MSHMRYHLLNLKTTSMGKVEILSNGWDKMINSMLQNTRDKYSRNLIEKLLCLNPEIKMAVLTKYI